MAAIYFCVAALLLLSADLFYFVRPVQFFLVALVLLTVFAGNQLNGADWINYTTVYARVAETTLEESLAAPDFEPLFTIWMWLFSHAGASYQTFVASIAVFNVGALLFVAILLRVRNIGFLFAIIFLMEGWSLYQEQIRNSLALSLCLLACALKARERPKLAIITLVIAVGFHFSALVGFFYIYLLDVIRRRNDLSPPSLASIVRSTIVVALIFGAPLYIGLRDPDIFSFVPIIPEKLRFYGEDITSGSSLLNAGLLIYPIGFLVLCQRYPAIARAGNVFLSFSFVVGVIWCLIGTILRTSAILTRFEHYFLMLIPFAFVAYRGDGAKVRISSCIVVLIFASIFTVRLLIQPGHAEWTANYQNVFISDFFGLPLKSEGARRTAVCDALNNAGIDFCNTQSLHP